MQIALQIQSQVVDRQHLRISQRSQCTSWVACPMPSVATSVCSCPCTRSPQQSTVVRAITVRVPSQRSSHQTLRVFRLGLLSRHHAELAALNRGSRLVSVANEPLKKTHMLRISVATPRRCPSAHCCPLPGVEPGCVGSFLPPKRKRRLGDALWKQEKSTRNVRTQSPIPCVPKDNPRLPRARWCVTKTAVTMPTVVSQCVPTKNKKMPNTINKLRRCCRRRRNIRLENKNRSELTNIHDGSTTPTVKLQMSGPRTNVGCVLRSSGLLSAVVPSPLRARPNSAQRDMLLTEVSSHLRRLVSLIARAARVERSTAATCFPAARRNFERHGRHCPRDPDDTPCSKVSVTSTHAPFNRGTRWYNGGVSANCTRLNTTKTRSNQHARLDLMFVSHFFVLLGAAHSMRNVVFCTARAVWQLGLQHTRSSNIPN